MLQYGPAMLCIQHWDVCGLDVTAFGEANLALGQALMRPTEESLQSLGES